MVYIYKTHWMYTHIMILHTLFVYWRAIVLGAFINVVIELKDLDGIWCGWCFLMMLRAKPEELGEVPTDSLQQAGPFMPWLKFDVVWGMEFWCRGRDGEGEFKNDIILLHPVNLVQSFGTFLVCLPTDYRRCASKLCFASWPLVCVAWSWIWIGFCCSD